LKSFIIVCSQKLSIKNIPIFSFRFPRFIWKDLDWEADPECVSFDKRPEVEGPNTAYEDVRPFHQLSPKHNTEYFGLKI
jgi:hypothetical protein